MNFVFVDDEDTYLSAAGCQEAQPIAVRNAPNEVKHVDFDVFPGTPFENYLTGLLARPEVSRSAAMLVFSLNELDA